MSKQRIVLIDRHPGRSAQSIGMAKELGTDPELIHEPSVGVVGTKGDSQCYLGVQGKVEAIHAHLKSRIGRGQGQLPYRLVQPEFTIATSDGIRNGTAEMRYSLIGREVTQDSLCEHLEATGLAGVIAVVACDKPPGRYAFGRARAQRAGHHHVRRHYPARVRPGVRRGAGHRQRSIRRPETRMRRCANGCPPMPVRALAAAAACSPTTPCRPLSAYSACSHCIWWPPPRMIRVVKTSSPSKLVEYLARMIDNGLKPRDIVSPDSLRNALIVAMAVGGSTNVVLHTPEIARAAGYEHFWRDIMTPEEFNQLSRDIVPVLTNARPYGKYSMLDIDRVGGVPVIVKELLDAGLLNGETMTCTGQTLAEQIEALDPPAPDGEVILPVSEPYKPTGGLRLLGGNLSPDFSAILKLAGVEGGLDDNLFKGRARVFEGERDLLTELDQRPDGFRNNDMIIVRYSGPTGAPGMPEMLDPTSRITALCRGKGHRRRPDDRRALLRRLGGAGDRPCRAGSRSGWPHRAGGRR